MSEQVEGCRNEVAMTLDTDRPSSRLETRSRAIRTGGLVLLLGGLVLTEPALAQSTGDAFCTSELAETVRNIFTVIQFGGPLIGGVLALGATVAIPTVRRVDLKKELKEVRNQGVIWGVIVAPLGTVILQFILNNVVSGGTSCGF